MNSVNISTAVASALLVTLPNFAILLISIYATRVFNTGWNGMGDAYAAKTVFMPARVWLIVLVPFIVCLFAGSLYFAIGKSPFYDLAAFGFLVSLGFVAITIAFYKIRLEIGNDALIYSSGLSRHTFPFHDIVDIRCFTGGFFVYLKNGRRFLMPLVFSDLKILGFTLRKIIYEK